MTSEPATTASLVRFQSIGAGLVALTLLEVMACAVVQQSPGIELDLEVVHDASLRSASLDGARSFETAEGMLITLDAAYVTLSSLELVACELAARVRPTAWRSVVWAHGTSTPTLLASPFVNGLERPDLEPASLGLLKPPPGSYCALRVTLAPADEDAAGLPANKAVVGQTLWLQGSWRKDSESTSTPLEVRSALVGTTLLSLPHAPWELTGEEPLPALRLRLAYDQWMDNVPLEIGDPDVLAVSLLTAILDSLTLEQKLD
ncbi:MAG: hypothetical protein ACKO6N_24415 [Myxococcota bacterium]